VVDPLRPTRGPWQPLYALAKDGRSATALRHCVVGYGGPTVLIVHTAAGVFLRCSRITRGKLGFRGLQHGRSFGA